MQTYLTKFGVIPRGLRLTSTVSYGVIISWFLARHAVLGIKPGKLAAWLFSRNAVLGMSPGKLGIQTVSLGVISLPGKSVMVDTARRISFFRVDALVVNTARRFVILQGA